MAVGNGSTSSDGGAILVGSIEYPLSIATSTLPSGTTGRAYSGLLTASGGTSPYSWSITSPSPPQWLNLDPSSGGLSGTPTNSGSKSVTFKVTDADGISRSVSLAISVFAEPGVYVPLTAKRICDTRANNPSHLSGAAAQCSNGTAGKSLATGGILTFNATGNFGVPASNVTAVVLSVATVHSKGPGFFTLFSAGQSRPTAANLNYANRSGGIQPGRGGHRRRRGGLSVLVDSL